MGFRLRNQNYPLRTIRFTTRTWFNLLEQAEGFGWNPMGTLVQGERQLTGSCLAPFGSSRGNYWSENESLVMLEDAFNLADALVIAFFEYEPLRLDSLHEYYAGDYLDGPNNNHPSIGAIALLIDFCQLGTFRIEKT